MEVHDAKEKSQAAKPSAVREEAKEVTSDPVSHFVIITRYRPNGLLQTIKENSSESLMPPLLSSQGRAGGRQIVNRGDLDQAIRSMRDGKRRARPSRPLSKIFLDGGKSQS
jgi:hypothetical protein